MKKAILAATIGLALIGGQALAQNNATARVSDRVGAQAGESEEFAGIPMSALYFAAAVLLVVVATDDDGDSN